MRRALLAALLLPLCSCPAPAQKSAPAAPASKANGMKLTSSAFADGGSIPARYGCSGASISPPLAISGVPGGAKTLALIVEDPDAPSGLFTHWVVWNIQPDLAAVAEGSAPAGVEGKNSYGKRGYGPPCPPSGEHRYIFRLFALDTALNLPNDAGRDQLLGAMKGHELAETRLMGRYRR